MTIEEFANWLIENQPRNIELDIKIYGYKNYREFTSSLENIDLNDIIKRDFEDYLKLDINLTQRYVE